MSGVRLFDRGQSRFDSAQHWLGAVVVGVGLYLAFVPPGGAGLSQRTDQVGGGRGLARAADHDVERARPPGRRPKAPTGPELKGSVKCPRGDTNTSPTKDHHTDTLVECRITCAEPTEVDLGGHP